MKEVADSSPVAHLATFACTIFEASVLRLKIVSHNESDGGGLADFLATCEG